MAGGVARQPDEVENGALVEVVDGVHHHHVHDVVGVGEQVQTARHPFLRHAQGTHEPAKDSKEVLKGRRERERRSRLLLWCVLDY